MEGICSTVLNALVIKQDLGIFLLDSFILIVSSITEMTYSKRIWNTLSSEGDFHIEFEHNFKEHITMIKIWMTFKGIIFSADVKNFANRYFVKVVWSVFLYDQPQTISV